MQNLNYTNKGGTYQSGRPSYPGEVYAYLVKAASLTKGSPVTDVGAGTGLFTRGFFDYPVNVTCVEKDPDMLAQLKQNITGAVILEGTAEHLPLPDNSQQLITAATAFHWFDAEAFRLECRRVLKKDGFVALLWNNMDYSCPILTAQTDINRRLCPLFHGYRGLRIQSAETFAPFFADGKWETRKFANNMTVDAEGFLRRALSSSYAPNPGDANYEEYVRETNAAFETYAENGVAVIGMETACYLGRV